MAAAIEDRGKMVFRRRASSAPPRCGSGVMGIVLAFPLLRSLGPSPEDVLDSTNWQTGSRLVDLDGRADPSGRPRGGRRMTVFPEGFARRLVGDQTMLIRADDKNLRDDARP